LKKTINLKLFTGLEADQFPAGKTGDRYLGEESHRREGREGYKSVEVPARRKPRVVRGGGQPYVYL